MHDDASRSEQQGGEQHGTYPKPASIHDRNSEPDEKELDNDKLVVLLSGKRKKKIKDIPLSLLFSDALDALLGITWYFSDRILNVNDQKLASWLECELKGTCKRGRPGGIVALLFITAFYIHQNFGWEETFFAALGDFIKQTRSKETALKGLEEELEVFPEFGATRKLSGKLECTHGEYHAPYFWSSADTASGGGVRS